MLKKAIELLFYKTFLFKLISSYGNIIAKVLVGMFGFF